MHGLETAPHAPVRSHERVGEPAHPASHTPSTASEPAAAGDHVPRLS